MTSIVSEDMLFLSASLDRMKDFINSAKITHRWSGCGEHICKIDVFLNMLHVIVIAENLKLNDLRPKFISLTQKL